MPKNYRDQTLKRKEFFNMKKFRIYDLDGTTTVITASTANDALKLATENGYKPKEIKEI